MLRWFGNVQNLDDCRKLFKKLCKQLHPDNGGSSVDFVNMKAEFEQVFNRLKDSVDHDSKEYKTAGSASIYADMIEKLQKSLHDVEIEQCGAWLYLHGQGTYDCKKTIKSFGFCWSGSKKCWYWFEGIEKQKADGRKYKGHYSMNTIRTMYGSEIYKTESARRIESR